MFELFENENETGQDMLGLCPCICVGPPGARQAIKLSLKFAVRALVPDNNDK